MCNISPIYSLLLCGIVFRCELYHRELIENVYRKHDGPVSQVIDLCFLSQSWKNESAQALKLWVDGDVANEKQMSGKKSSHGFSTYSLDSYIMKVS